MSYSSVSLILIFERKTKSIDNFIKLIDSSKKNLDIELIVLLTTKLTQRDVSVLKKIKQKIQKARFVKETEISFSVIKKTIDLATKKYISFVSLENIYSEDFLKRMVGRIETTSSDIVLCDFSLISENGKEISVPYSLKSEFLLEKGEFSSNDTSKYLFNLTPLTSLNKIFKKSFLEEVEFEISKNVSGIRAFLMEALVQANKISCIDSWLFSQPEDNFQKENSIKVIENLKSLIQEFGDVYYFLIKNEKYAMYQQSFLNYYLTKLWSVFLWIKEPYKSICKNLIQNIAINYFDAVELLNSSYCYDKALYNWMETITAFSDYHKNFEDIYLYHKEDIIPISMAINDKYVPYAGVTISSIKEHLKSEKICDIYIMYSELSLENKQKLKELENKNIRINFIDIKDKILDKSLDEKLNRDLSHISQETFYRFLISEELIGYDKVIYLDADLIVQEDISLLFDINMADNLLAGCYNPASCSEEYDYFEKKLRIDPLSYINAGVLLINTHLWRKEKISYQCFSILESYKNSLKYQDQDVLNIVCQYRILLLEYNWNFIYSLFTQKNEAYMELLQRKGFHNSPNQLKILHYTWCFKPWNYPERVFANTWWTYARKTPFYELILFENLKKNVNQIEIKSSGVLEKKEDKIVTNEMLKKYVLMHKNETYLLVSRFLKEALGYFFSFGEKKYLYRQKLDRLLIELKSYAKKNIS